MSRFVKNIFIIFAYTLFEITLAFPLPWFTRGYTGHEHVDEFGLINMNARLYDPVTARFLSPDAIVANPFATQSYNRYSYCGNNPVMFVDLDGNEARSSTQNNKGWNLFNYMLKLLFD